MFGNEREMDNSLIDFLLPLHVGNIVIYLRSGQRCELIVLLHLYQPNDVILSIIKSQICSSSLHMVSLCKSPCVAELRLDATRE